MWFTITGPAIGSQQVTGITAASERPWSIGAYVLTPSIVVVTFIDFCS